MVGSHRWKLALLTFAIALPAVAAVTPADWKKHPALHKAFDALDTAKKTFEGGNPHPAFADEALFGGHRQKAYKLTLEAMAEMEKAMESAGKEPVKK